MKLPPFAQRAFPLSRGVPAAHRPLVKALFKEEGFFRGMAPIEGAVEALHQMVAEGPSLSPGRNANPKASPHPGQVAEGIDVRLCSSPLSRPVGVGAGVTLTLTR